MPSLKDLLTRRLRAASRVAVLAVGSPLRADDGAGSLAAGELQRLLSPGSLSAGSLKRPGRVTSVTAAATAARGPSDPRQSPDAPECAIFIGETAPESLTGPIKRFAPTHLVILDAADFGGAPGELAIISPDQIRGNPSMSTHNLPLNVLTDYLVAHLKCEVVILGIQPASSRFGGPVAKAVAAGARELAAILAACLRGG